MSNATLEMAFVGITDTCELLETFTGPDCIAEAEAYINTLPDVELGIYYLDSIPADDC